MNPHPLAYILVMAAVTYLIRMLPLTLIRGQIRSPFIRSFLYYVPYVTPVRHDPSLPFSPQPPPSGPERRPWQRPCFWPTGEKACSRCPWRPALWYLS